MIKVNYSFPRLAFFVTALFFLSTACSSEPDQADCTAGEFECGCYQNGSCNLGLSCIEGQCGDCAPGMPGCGCDERSRCDEGTVCQSNLCVPYTCESDGELGCACAYGDSCAEGLSCNPNGQCAPCTSDLRGCPCDDQGRCGPNLVCGTDDLCKRDPSLGTRLVSQCYTPCRRDLIREDGRIRRCSAEGLMRGCVDDAMCIAGSCVAEESGPRQCTADSDCPDFQRCEDGQCYSTCEGPNDCGGNTECYRHVCRQPCTVAGRAECEGGSFCQIIDGRQGYCIPFSGTISAIQAGDSVDDDDVTVHSALIVNPAHLGMTTSRMQRTIALTNTGEIGESFLVRKTRHVANVDQPNEEIVDRGQGTVMPWIEMGTNEFALSSDDEIEVFVPLNQSVEIVIRAAPDDAPRRWEGRFEIVPSSPTSRMAPSNIFVNYAGDPDGRWAGQAFYFANFGTSGLDAWIKDRDGVDLRTVGNAFVRKWRQFMVSQYSDQPERFARFEEVLQATRTESWSWPSVRNICPRQTSGAENRCYLSGVSQGWQYYSNDPATNPVPWGVNELPVAFHIRNEFGSDATELVGRIDSASALHYPGNPQLRLSFKNDPTSCPNQDQTGRDRTCVVPLEEFGATVILSGRYPASPQGSCAGVGQNRTFEKVGYPWLIPGFVSDVSWSEEQQSYVRYECRGEKYPYGPGERCEGSSCGPVRPGAQTDGEKALNRRLAQANPVPDGQQRVRRISLVDGAMINGETLFIIFKEEMESFMGEAAVASENFEVYGFMILTRSNSALAPDDYEGVDLEAASSVNIDDARLTYQCSDEFLRAFTPRTSVDDLSTGEVAELTQVMLDGRTSAHVDVIPVPNTEGPGDEHVHYLCKRQDVITAPDGTIAERRVVGVFNQGFHADDAICPESAQITFFTLKNVSDQVLRNVPCNAQGNCHEIYDQWITGVRTQQDFGNGQTRAVTDILRPSLYWECTDSRERECSNNRNELRQGKTFYAEADISVFMQPLGQTIAEAFRFRTQFLSRDGTAVGFAPEICVTNPNTTPFCYDPFRIEEIRDRVDCLTDLYNRRRDALKASNLDQAVRSYLLENFSQRTEYRLGGVPRAGLCNPADTSLDCRAVRQMGFERLYAELLIMLGDDAYTQAFASRFDLAGASNHSFDGEAFEGPSGIKLSGGAGFEMHTLHQSIQYYQLVLDRFYSLSKAINYSLENDQKGTPSQRLESFISPEMVTLYFDRLIRASMQKSRAHSEVAKRYMYLNRPQLARSVVERGYAAAYLESIIFSRLMDGFVDVTSPSSRAQIFKTMDEAQRRYRMALLDMRNVYADITDDLTVFGFAPDYIPFPVLGTFDANAFERAMSIARSRLATAAEKETLALESSRTQRTDMVSFQNELRSISLNYENQLADLCGTAEGADGTLYPAIPRYNEFFKDAGILGLLSPDDEADAYVRRLIYQDPCGRFGTGRLHESVGQSIIASLDYEVERQKLQNLVSSISAAQTRLKAFCDVDFDISNDVRWSAADGQITTLNIELDKLRDDIDTADRALAATMDSLGAASNCVGHVIGAAGASEFAVPAMATLAGAACIVEIGGTIAAHVAVTDVAEKAKKKIRDKQSSLRDFQTQLGVIEREWQHSKDCEIAGIDMNEQIANIVSETLTQQIEILRAIEVMNLERSRVNKTRAEVQRLLAEFDEANGLVVNLEAARNDPNVRIYKNDAVITADRTFNAALQATYKATKVLEYYTGQSFAGLDKLFLARTVSFGDYSLESYLAALEDMYYEFQEDFGQPDVRLLIRSVRDDIFLTDLYGPDASPLSQRVRDEDFTRILTDQRRLDDRGYITIPFSTALRETSPLTHNHKILYMQAEILYEGRTDALARVYVRQSGTGTVRTFDSMPLLYRFPERTAVINPFFNGSLRQLEGSDISTDDLDGEIFKSRRLRDRPLINTSWDIVLNLLDEQVNQDIDLNKIRDIRLYVYYTDFTNL